MKFSQIEKRIPQTLTNSKDIIQKDREHARRIKVAGQDQRAAKKIRPEHCTSRASWGDLSAE